MIIFLDGFPGGKPELAWQPWPAFHKDALHGAVDPSSPGKASGVGVLTNANGGFSALSYVPREVPRDFALDTWLRTTVTGDQKGPLNGLVFRADPAGERYYRFASRFGAEPTLSLAYVGRDVRNFPVYVRVWPGAEIPGGPPTASGWHHVRIEVIADQADVYWDGVRLPGGQLAVERVPAGYVGIYATNTGAPGRVETRVAEFVVEQE